ncbi:hypothetical protein Mapa_000148 [Marchantia paleacea]|nr:hypothetical protein Mapa_000148 [Marchantia paleacea]
MDMLGGGGGRSVNVTSEGTLRRSHLKLTVGRQLNCIVYSLPFMRLMEQMAVRPARSRRTFGDLCCQGFRQSLQAQSSNSLLSSDMIKCFLLTLSAIFDRSCMCGVVSTLLMSSTGVSENLTALFAGSIAST